MDLRDAQALLGQHGFPCGAPDGEAGPRTHQATLRFQRAWCGGKSGQGRLAQDGVCGPLTRAALAGLPHLSPHFVVGEMASKGDRTCYVRWELLAALEQLRAAEYPRGLVVVSAYRDPAHNRSVGGAPSSMHVEGLAADVGGSADVDRVQRLGLFSGLGTRGRAVRHVDLRHLAGGKNRTPAATPSRPARWAYA